MVLSIDQSAHDLSGTATVEVKVGDNHTKLIYSVIGVIWEGFLTANFRSVDRTQVQFAVVMFRVKDGGKALVGQYVHNAPPEDEPVPTQIYLVRK